MASPSPSLLSGVVVSFGLKALLRDGTTRLYANICGHRAVGLPLAANNEPATLDHMQLKGVDNLRIPIDVGRVLRASSSSSTTSSGSSRVKEVNPPTTSAAATPPAGSSAAVQSNGDAYVDVFLHPDVVGLARQAILINEADPNAPHRDVKVLTLFAILKHVVGLSMQWIAKETGLLAVGSSISVQPEPFVKPGGGSGSGSGLGGTGQMPTMEELQRMMAAMGGKIPPPGAGGPTVPTGSAKRRAASTDDEATETVEDGPSSSASLDADPNAWWEQKFKVPSSSSSTTDAATTAAGGKKKGPMVMEMPTTAPGSGLKKGFLNDPGAKSIVRPGRIRAG